MAGANLSLQALWKRPPSNHHLRLLVTDYLGSHFAYLLFNRWGTTKYLLTPTKPTSFGYRLKIYILALKDCLKTDIGIEDRELWWWYGIMRNIGNLNRDCFGLATRLQILFSTTCSTVDLSFAESWASFRSIFSLLRGIIFPHLHKWLLQTEYVLKKTFNSYYFKFIIVVLTLASLIDSSYICNWLTNEPINNNEEVN